MSSNVKFYCAAFDADGKRISSTTCRYDTADEKNSDKIKALIDDMKTALSKNSITPAIIEIIPADDYDLYTQKNYVRGADGKPIPYVFPIPTDAEIKAAHAGTIAAKYDPQIAELKDAKATADLTGDAEASEEIKAEYADTMSNYNKELEALEND